MVTTMTLIKRLRYGTAAFGIAALFGALATACAGGGTSPTAAGPTAAGDVTLSMDYPTYDTVSSISARADLIAVGTVRNQQARSIQMVPPDIVDKLPQYKKQNTDTVVTDHTVVLNRTLKGQNGNTIIVVQPGGSLGGRHFVTEDETLLKQGSSYLLFLRQGDDGKYFLIGGAQGVYDVYSGKLRATGALGATSQDVRSQLNGRTVESVASDAALHSSSAQPTSSTPGQGDPPAPAPPEKLQAKPPAG